MARAHVVATASGEAFVEDGRWKLDNGTTVRETTVYQVLVEANDWHTARTTVGRSVTTLVNHIRNRVGAATGEELVTALRELLPVADTIQHIRSFLDDPPPELQETP